MRACSMQTTVLAHLTTTVIYSCKKLITLAPQNIRFIFEKIDYSQGLYD
jgi:hypothetical protein